MGRGNAGKVGAVKPPQPSPQLPPPVEIVQYPIFAFTVDRYGEDGDARLLGFHLPDGRRLEFPLSPENGKKMSDQLAAPSVDAAGGGLIVPGE